MDDRDDIPTIDVLGLGAVAVDDLLYVESYPEAESKVRVLRRERQCGGQTGTALVAAARFGVRAAYAGALGENELSRKVRDNFTREGVETRWAPVLDGGGPAHSTIIVDEGTKTRTIFASVEEQFGAAPGQPSADIIRRARVLLVDHHGMEGSLRAARIARNAGCAIVADFERPAESPFEQLFGYVDHLIVPAQFAERMTGSANPAEAALTLAALGREMTAVTCGAEGCYYCTWDDPGCVYHQPAFPVEVADTTGCGDVFHGVYAAALSRQYHPAECIRLASAAAAIKAGHRGGQAGIPRRDAVERMLS